MNSSLVEAEEKHSPLSRDTEPPRPTPAVRLAQGVALRRLAINLLVLVVLVATALLVCEGVASVAFPPTRFEQKLRAQAASPTDLQVAISGSSRAARGLDPRGLAWRAYNYGDDGQSPNFICQGIEMQLPRQPGLRGVVLVLDEFAFGTHDEAVPAPDYVRWGYKLEAADAGWADTLAAHSRLYRYRRDLLPQLMGRLLGSSTPPSLVSESDTPVDAVRICLMAKTGYIYTPPQPVGPTPAEARPLATVHNTYYDQGLRAGNLRRLRALLEEASRRHLRVAIVQPPLHPTYRHFIRPDMLASYKVDVASLLEGFSTDCVRFRSYFDDPRFSDGEFSDPDHLDSIGALHWARILSEEMSDFFGSS